MSQIQPTFRRKIFFIHKDFQSKFILRFCGIVLVSTTVMGLILWWATRTSTTIVFQDLRLLCVPTQKYLFPSFMIAGLVVLLLSVWATLMITLVTSHRIGGPLYRFELALKKLKAGDLKQKVILREYDQCQELGTLLDETIFSLREKVRSIDDEFSELKKNHPEIKADGQPLEVALKTFEY